jgi:hypothetical protein
MKLRNLYSRIHIRLLKCVRILDLDTLNIHGGHHFSLHPLYCPVCREQEVRRRSEVTRKDN